MSARSQALAAVLLPVAMAATGCQLTTRSLGESCLKDQDCLSGICSQLTCAAAPPLLQNIPPGSTPEAGTVPEAAVPDATTEAATEAGAPDSAGDVRVDSSSSSSGGDSGSGRDSAVDSSAVEASTDATSE